MPYLTVGRENGSDVRLYYEDHGAGEVLLLIHGFPFSRIAWEKEEAFFLSKGYRVISYDRRGFGNSSKPGFGYNWDTFADDLELLMSHLDLYNVTLVGHSMGTGEITRYLSRYGSAKVSRSVLISPIPPYLLRSDYNPDGVDISVIEGFKDAVKKDRYSFIADFLENFYSSGKLFGDTGVSNEKLKADFQVACMSSPIAMLRCIDTWGDDFRINLRSFNIPTLVIQGDADKVLPLEATGKLLVETIDARLKVIAGGSHGIPWTHAEEISNEILEFILESPGKMKPVHTENTARFDESSFQ